ncbi:hypothetical protein J3E69DRAFT_325875 [Trichoderma sp. SZMC 28015]
MANKKEGWMVFFDKTSMDAHWAATAFGSLAARQTTHTHTYTEWRPISTRVFSPSRWIADALLARALPWAFCSGPLVASRDLSVVTCCQLGVTRR